MNTRDLERLLRAAPPDEPEVARSLQLPVVPVEVVGRGAGERHAPRALPRALATGVVAIVVVAMALATVSQLRLPFIAPVGGPGSADVPAPGLSPSAHVPGTVSPFASFRLGAAEHVLPGVTARIPVDWQLLPVDEGGEAPRVAVANFDLVAACGTSATSACVDAQRLTAGEILITFGNDDNGHTVAEVMAPTGPDARIDGMPAARQIVEVAPGTDITGVDVPPGCDAYRAWWIGRPTSTTGWLAVDGCSARGDRAEFERIVDQVATSVRFTATPSGSTPAAP